MAAAELVQSCGPTARAELERRAIYVGLGCLLIAPILIKFYWPAADGLDIIGYPIGRDFINVWAGPQLAFGGKLATLFDLDAYHQAIGDLFGRPIPFHNWGYPLFVLPAFWPLAQLPYLAALAVWTFGLFAAFAGVTLSEVAPERRVMALVLLACAPACLINAVGGQNGFLSGALFIGGVLAIDRRPILAGVLFGLLTFKPHLGVVLPFALIALGAWRVIASAAVTAVVLVGVSTAIFGIEPWRQYLEVAGAFQVLLLERFHGFYTYMMTSVVAGGRIVGLSYAGALALQLVVSLPVLAAACWAVRRTADPCRRAFVLVAAAPLITPYAFNYDLTALAAVQVWMLVGRLPWRAEWSALSFIVWALPLALMYMNMLGLGIAPLFLILMFWASLREATDASSVGAPHPVVSPGPGGPGMPLALDGAKPL